ncbi:hypothetical protein MACJ_002616 [Theileria orientalis]|uniref:Uncharacterized protein n=1 Tax=Theileria orientalis TaxID=68886 RepID=A0A976M7X2_THEOR|nr:hypothetical protein MACJ_002616 [Theileria orientalis]
MKVYNYIKVIILSNVSNIYSDPNLKKRDNAVEDLDLTKDAEKDEKVEPIGAQNECKMLVNVSKNDKPSNKTCGGSEFDADRKPNITTKCDEKPDISEENRRPDNDCDQDKREIAVDVTVIPDETVSVNPNEEVKEVDEDPPVEEIGVKYVAEVEEDENSFSAYAITMIFIVSFSIAILF